MTNIAIINSETGEIVTLQDCEAVIKAGLATFVDVGNALLQIRDGRLYRDQFDTFEEYCRERWGFNRAHAYRMIEASEVVGVLSPMGDTPRNERQARALAPLRDQPEKMAEAWSEAVETSGGKPTAKTVSEVVERHTDSRAEHILAEVEKPGIAAWRHGFGKHLSAVVNAVRQVQVHYSDDEIAERYDDWTGLDHEIRFLRDFADWLEAIPRPRPGHLRSIGGLK